MSENGGTNSGAKEVDWTRFGLSAEKKTPQNGERELSSSHPPSGKADERKKSSNVKELFEEDQGEENQKPWWKANFFVRSPVLFGTWDGVFTSCMLNIFGVVIFLRTGWMVGNAGVGLSLLIVVLTLLMALAPALSAIGVCERCRVESGGVYFLLAHVLGGRAGGTIGILYVFGMTVSISLFCAGFGESLAQTTNWQSPWAVRVIGLTTALVLLVVVLAGVKWVVKLQLLLLAILMLSVLDFVIGTFAHTDYAAGFTGYRTENMENNAPPKFANGDSFFTVFGVFFPSACGVLAGINMSGDLKDPSRNIPAGTLGALGISGMLYILFVILLGAVCTREALVSDYMIASKVSLVGVLFLFGLYVSSLSSCLGAQYGAPRILQCISKENIIPLIKPLGSGRGPNKEPVVASLCVAVISMAFILIGNLNALAPIVTMPFLLTYAGIDYAYFKLAMSYDVKQKKKLAEMETGTTKATKHSPPEKNTSETKLVIDGEGVNKSNYGTDGVQDTEFTQIQSPENGNCEKDDSQEKENADKDSVKEEEGQNETIVQLERSEGSDGEGILKPASYDCADTTRLIEKEGVQKENVKRRKLKEDGKNGKKKPYKEERQIKWEIEKQPTSYYSDLCNRWVSLAGAFASIFIMFLINWGYALANISVALLVYIYIGQANPGVSKGIAADFSFYKWMQSLWERVRRKPQTQQQIVVPTGGIPYGVSTYQLTEENGDFANRDRRHHSSVVTASLAPQ